MTSTDWGEAAILGNIEVLSSISRCNFRRSIVYTWTMQRLWRLAAQAGQAESLRTLFHKPDFQLSDQDIIVALRTGSQPIVRFLRDEICLRPSELTIATIASDGLASTCHLNELTFLLSKQLFIALLLCPLDMDFMRHLIRAHRDELSDFTYTDKEQSMLAAYSPYRLTPPIADQLPMISKGIRGDRAPPKWQARKYMTDCYGVCPAIEDRDFAAVCREGDLDGVRFYTETLGFFPEDLSALQDDIFAHERVARYVVQEMSLTDWEEYLHVYK